MELIRVEPVQCSSCSRNVRPPFVICEANHLVCTRCKSHLESASGSMVNDSLPVASEQCDLPCLNTGGECQFLSEYYKYMEDYCTYECGYRSILTEVLEHELICPKLLCNPVTKCKIDGCEWMRVADLLRAHVHFSHPESVVLLDQINNIVVIKPTDVAKLLVFSDANMQNRHACYWLLVHNNQYLTVHCAGFEGPSCDLLIMHNFYVPTTVSGQFLEGTIRKLGDPPIDAVCDGVPVSFNEDMVITFDQEVKTNSDLECDICAHVMYPPIRQCMTGHSMCHDCILRLGDNKCPTCRNVIGGTRNFALERIVEKTVLPCKHRHLGCLQRDIFSVIKEHSKCCTFQKVRCYRNCAWDDSLHFLADHMLAVHSNLAVFKNNSWSRFSFQLNKTYALPLILYNQVFIVRSGFKDGFYITINHISLKSEPEFFFDAALCDVHQKHFVNFNMACSTTTDINSKIVDQSTIFPISKDYFENFIYRDLSVFIKLKVYKKL